MDDHTPVPDRVLSIRQPWAALILEGHKGVENRTWDTLWRGRMLVHAGKLPDPFGPRAGAQIIGYDAMDDLTENFGSYRGAYLGAVTLVDVHKEEHGCCQPWGDPEQYHWVVTDPVKLSPPIPGPGRLALYRTPDDIRAALEAQQA